MWCRIIISFIVITVSATVALADCPSADQNGDCFVDFEDVAFMAAQWPNVFDNNDLNTLATQWLTTDPCVPDDMTYIPNGEFEMGDHFADGVSDELPLHAVLLDAFFMGKFEITNRQYCDYLNSAILAGDIHVVNGIVYHVNYIGNNYLYCETHINYDKSQIDYNNVSQTFSVRTKGEPPRDMNDDPMVGVTWNGAAAYCNWRNQQEGYQALYDSSDPNWPCDFTKKGYRLPTEAEWEYAVHGGENAPYYRFPWGDTISHSQANYWSSWSEGSPRYPYDVNPTEGYHPDWDDGITPYTSPCGSFSANGYGLYDMAGNVWEWCNDWYDANYYDVSPYGNPTGAAPGSYRVLRGGSWYNNAYNCRVSDRRKQQPFYRFGYFGFRVVLDLK